MQVTCLEDAAGHSMALCKEIPVQDQSTCPPCECNNNWSLLLVYQPCPGSPDLPSILCSSVLDVQFIDASWGLDCVSLLWKPFGSPMQTQDGEINAQYRSAYTASFHKALLQLVKLSSKLPFPEICICHLVSLQLLVTLCHIDPAKQGQSAGGMNMVPGVFSTRVFP